MKPGVLAAFVLALLGGGAGFARAQVITVTSGTDVIDIDTETATVADLPGPDGKVSFPEAMIASNHTPGRQTIGFAVPPAEWQMQWYYPNRAAIVHGWPSTATDPVTIDGTTQTAFTGDTNPGGAEVVLMGSGIWLNADDCVVRGVDNTSIGINGSRARILENTNVGINFYGGSGGLVQANSGGYVQFDQSSDNIVIGNTFKRVRVLGWFAGGRPAINNRIGGPQPSDRNHILGYGTWNSEGGPGGFAVQLFDTDGTILENNSIGTTPDGLAPADNATTSGVRLESRNTNVVVRNNRIAGILARSRPHLGPGIYYGSAIEISGTGDGFEIVGNTIGLNANGDPVLGSVYGIDAGSWQSPDLRNVNIGGPDAGLGNTIAGHLLNGVVVGREAQGVRISGNAIYANRSIGIDLVTSGSIHGVTPNDPLDPDTGGNGLQNFPEIQSATGNGSTVHATGRLQSEASSQYRIEFFASPGCDSLGTGEGQVYLGSTEVTTSAAGNAGFDVVLAGSVPAGWVLTSTATRAGTGATSEFSACLVVSGGVTGISPAIDPPRARLSPALPNPFQATTTLRYDLPREGMASLSIYDIGGRLVRELANGTHTAGSHEISWDGTDAGGRPVTVGIYLVRLRTDRHSITRRVIRTR